MDIRPIEDAVKLFFGCFGAMAFVLGMIFVGALFGLAKGLAG